MCESCYYLFIYCLGNPLLLNSAEYVVAVSTQKINKYMDSVVALTSFGVGILSATVKML